MYTYIYTSLYIYSYIMCMYISYINVLTRPLFKGTALRNLLGRRVFKVRFVSEVVCVMLPRLLQVPLKMKRCEMFRSLFLPTLRAKRFIRFMFGSNSYSHLFFPEVDCQRVMHPPFGKPYEPPLSAPTHNTSTHFKWHACPSSYILGGR